MASLILTERMLLKASVGRQTYSELEISCWFRRWRCKIYGDHLGMKSSKRHYYRKSQKKNHRRQRVVNNLENSGMFYRKFPPCTLLRWQWTPTLKVSNVDKNKNQNSTFLKNWFGRTISEAIKHSGVWSGSALYWQWQVMMSIHEVGPSALISSDIIQTFMQYQ